MEKKRGKHWTIKFDSDIKWINYGGICYSLCDCGKHEKIEIMFTREKEDITITLIAENAKEDKQLIYKDYLVNTDKYDTVIHVLEQGVDY